MRRWLVAVFVLFALSVGAQPNGGLYIAGAGFDFPQAGERAVAQNPNSRFFLLVLGDAVRYLSLTAPEEMVEVRNKVMRGEVVFLVCERDVSNGRYRLRDLVPGVVPVRGWPAPGSNALPPGTKYYPHEDPSVLPPSTEALRRLRATCS